MSPSLRVLRSGGVFALLTLRSACIILVGVSSGLESEEEEDSYRLDCPTKTGVFVADFFRSFATLGDIVRFGLKVFDENTK